MNDLSTSKPSRSQNTWSSLPWGTFFFLLAVFALSTPFFRAIGSFGLGIGGIGSGGGAIGQTRSLDEVRIVALISLGAVALFNLLRRKSARFQINGLLGWLILFYLVLAALSITWSIDTLVTIKRVGILLLLSLGALYVADRFSLQETIALVFFICAIAVLVSLIISLRNSAFHPFVGSWRFSGKMHPILQGWHCGLLLLSAFVFYKTADKNRAVYLGIAFIAFILLILTRSRMPLASSILASAVYWYLTSSKRYQGVILFLGIISFICSLYLMAGDGKGFGEQTIMLGRIGEVETTTSLTGRIPLWSAMMTLVNERPFVGYGYDSSLVSHNLLRMKWMTGWQSAYPHSGYMATLGGLGYIGAVTLVLILVLSVKMSIGLAKRNSEYAFIIAVLVWLILNLVTEDKLLTRPYFPVFVWMIMLARLGFIREKR